MHIQRIVGSLRTAIAASAIIGGIVATTDNAAAQDIPSLKAPTAPLILKTQGSFVVGGKVTHDVGLGSTTDDVIVEQMYGQYMVPLGKAPLPVVMIHGLGLSGKTYETTPDGRMGWDEYFVRKGYATYIVDQVSRGRSGFNPSVFNKVRTGALPPTAQPATELGSPNAWTLFRFGPTPGTPFRDGQFPVKSAIEFLRQQIPSLNQLLPTPDPNHKVLSELAINLNGAVLIGHSQGGLFPAEAALSNPAGVKGIVMIEPSTCKAATYTDDEIAKLAKTPILIVFGDHLDADTGFPGFTWRLYYDDCMRFIGRIKAAKGNAKMLHPPSLGIRGNSHMIMQDKNNLQIADLIMKWIDQNVKVRKPLYPWEMYARR